MTSASASDFRFFSRRVTSEEGHKHDLKSRPLNFQIPFLDTLTVRKPDGSVKLLVYRKATPTDQYLNFASHHQLNHKLGVVRTLLDRMDRILTEDVDKQKEEDTIKKALGKCGYPSWSFEQVKKKMQSKKQKVPIKNKDSSQKSRGMVVGRGDKLENFDLIFFPTSKTWKGLLTTN